MLPHGLKRAKNGSLGKIDPTAAEGNKHRLSTEQHAQLSSSAERWMFTHKSSGAYLGSGITAHGKRSESEFDEFLMRAGEKSPTVADLARWRYLMAKADQCLGKKVAQKYLDTICRWKQHDRQDDAEFLAATEAYIRRNLIPESGPVDASTATNAKQLGVSIDALVAARNAAAEFMNVVHLPEDLQRGEVEIAASAFQGSIVSALASLLLHPLTSWPLRSHQIEQWLVQTGVHGFNLSSLADALHCEATALDALVCATKADQYSVSKSCVSLENPKDLLKNRHWSFCRPLFASTRQYNLTGGSPGALVDSSIAVVFDIRYVFESAKGAKRFLHRGLNYLAENHIDDSIADLADRITGGHCHQQVKDAPSFGDESFVFGGDGDPGVKVKRAIFHRLRPDSPSSMNSMNFMNVLIRVRNVVAKLFVSVDGSADEHSGDIYALATHVSERLSSWVQRFGQECGTVVKRLPDTARCAYDAFLAAHRVLAKCLLQEASASHSMYAIANSMQTCARCGVQSRSCKRCGGCYRYYLCGSDCQRLFWECGHKTECSREFELTLLT